MTKMEKVIEYREKIEEIQDEFNKAFPIEDFKENNALTKASTNLSQAQGQLERAEEEFVLEEYRKKNKND